MYLIFRCDCGRVLYAKKGVATRKCVCGKSLKVKQRRIFKKVETAEDASETVRKMQEEIYGGTTFKKASELPKGRRI
jgi:hypothetical protein